MAASSSNLLWGSVKQVQVNNVRSFKEIKNQFTRRCGKSYQLLRISKDKVYLAIGQGDGHHYIPIKSVVPRSPVKEGALKNFAKFTGKHLR